MDFRALVGRKLGWVRAYCFYLLLLVWEMLAVEIGYVELVELVHEQVEVVEVYGLWEVGIGAGHYFVVLFWLCELIFEEIQLPLVALDILVDVPLPFEETPYRWRNLFENWGIFGNNESLDLVEFWNFRICIDFWDYGETCGLHADHLLLDWQNLLLSPPIMLAIGIPKEFLLFSSLIILKFSEFAWDFLLLGFPPDVEWIKVIPTDAGREGAVLFVRTEVSGLARCCLEARVLKRQAVELFWVVHFISARWLPPVVGGCHQWARAYVIWEWFL